MRSIAHVTARAMDLDLLEPFAIATGAQTRAENVLVEVELEDGARGFGEAAPFPAVSGETQTRSLEAVAGLAPALLGRSAESWRAIAGDLARAAPGEPAARSGLEQAILDALARSLGIPLATLYGGAGEQLVTDFTVTAGSIEHARASATNIAERGFCTIKIKVGGRGDGFAEDAERVGAVHEAAPHARLLLDANGGFDPDGALALMADLERRNIHIALFEQPVPPGDASALARVRGGCRVPICADESARSAADVLDLVRADAIDAVNVKIMKTGIVEALAIIEIAKAAKKTLMIGGMVESEIAMLHSAHLASGTGGFAFVDLDTPLFFAAPATREGYPIRRDRIELSRAPGLGVTPL